MEFLNLSDFGIEIIDWSINKKIFEFNVFI